MAGSTRTYAYALTPPAEDTEKVLARANRILGWACDGDDRIICHGITGAAFGTVVLNLTVRGRDQWHSRQLAQNILNYITWSLGQSVEVEMDLQSWRQQTHMNRGYAHGRTKRHREKKMES